MQFENEIWKDIPDYEGFYMVSNYGRVRSLYNYKRDGTNILRPRLKNGYYQLGLRKNNKRKWIAIHRLVALAFIPNSNNFPCINHKDENPLNNNVNNLEWCTVKYNNCYGTRLERVANSNKTKKIILKYDLEGNFIEEYKSISEAGRKNNVGIGNIISCCKGKYKQMGGYIWKYKGVVSQ